MEPLIRPAQASDTKAVVTIIEKAYAIWRTRLNDLPDVTAGIANEIASGSVWIADADGGPSGIVVAKLHDGVMHLANLAVVPEAGGRGIGSALVRAVEAEGARLGAHSLRLATHARMEQNLRFYERLGWHVTAREGNKVLMARHLPSADQDG